METAHIFIEQLLTNDFGSLIFNIKSNRLCSCLSSRLVLQINDSKLSYKMTAAPHSRFFSIRTHTHALTDS